MKRLLSVGLPMALQFSITAIGGIIMQVAVNGLGANAVAAMTSANKIHLIFCSTLETIGIAMATYCSQNMGAQKYSRIRKGIKTANLLAIGFAIFDCMILWLFGKYIALLFIDASEAAIMADIQLFLKVTSLAYPLLGILFVFRNSIQGMGYGLLPMTAGLFELVGRSTVAFTLVGRLAFWVRRLPVRQHGLRRIYCLSAYIIILKRLYLHGFLKMCQRRPLRNPRHKTAFAVVYY